MYYIILSNPCPNPDHAGKTLYFVGWAVDSRAPTGVCECWSTDKADALSWENPDGAHDTMEAIKCGEVKKI